jgi:hypothetical protein
LQLLWKNDAFVNHLLIKIQWIVATNITTSRSNDITVAQDLPGGTKLTDFLIVFLRVELGIPRSTTVFRPDF